MEKEDSDEKLGMCTHMSPANIESKLNQLTAEQISELIKENDRFKRENRWKSACCNVDKRCLIFGSQLAITFSILVFSFYQTIRDPEECTFSGLIGTILGLFIPSPIVMLN